MYWSQMPVAWLEYKLFFPNVDASQLLAAGFTTYSSAHCVQGCQKCW